MAMSNIRPTRPTIPKTTPDRTRFCRKPVGVGVVVEKLVMTVDVWVRVCSGTDVTTAGGEGAVEVVEVLVEVVEVDGVVDGVVEVDVLVLFKTEKLAVISK